MKPLRPHEAKAQGYTIDETTYPWFAYKGPRFKPTDYRDCYTNLEANLMHQLERRGIEIEL